MLFCWLYTLGGAGTGMNVWAMTTLRFPPHEGYQQMSAHWDATYVALLLVMWFAMMLAMMLPGLMLQVFREPGQWVFSLRFVGEYSLVWLGFSLAAVALQFGVEKAGWLDGMRMWSVSDALSRTLLGFAALSQIWRLANPQSLAGRAQGMNCQTGFCCGFSCLITTGPVMLLLYVGGIMNVYWIFVLTFWAMALKEWPKSRIVPLLTIATCLNLALLA